ncbi:ComEC/Rec2 family competence protein [Chitinophaga deserti]|uniref:ComEC/Rec2 family competence protein n=1 Tax=Chitinophaga deserti TaxID=2164099 RepID=UPI000D6B77AC|nr:ComEC/Rec2 family competence protein [Chitinophaga deserti]
MKNHVWKAAPFLRLLPLLALGALAGTYFPQIPWIMICLCVTCWALPLLLPLRMRYALHPLQGAGVMGAVFCAGMLLPAVTDIRQHPQWIGHYGGDTLRVSITLMETPQRKARSWKAECRIESVQTKGIPQTATGNMILYFAEDPGLKAGNRIFASVDAALIRNSGNPGSYDYAAYCARRGICHRAFLTKYQWRPIPGNGFSKAEQWLYNAHAYTLKTLEAYIPGKENAGIAEALLVGYRANLDADVVRDYTNTGVVHIIAISGLHLGLIYLGGVQLMLWLPQRRWANILRAVLLIAVLWFFSLLTGASASVLRSAMMFTAIAAGSYLVNRHVSSHNNLAAAAFLLLAFCPAFLTDAGFQLSFLAVAGIQTCYLPLYGCWAPRWSWLDKIWQLVAVSLAAQVFTLPVCLYYFRQFPVYFLPANLIAVPWSTMLLYGELLLMAISWWEAGAGWLGWAIGWGIEGMNLAIGWLSALPGAVWNNIRISLTETFILYAVLCSGVAAGMLRSKRCCFATCLLALIGSVLHAVEKINAFSHRTLVVMNIPKSTVVACIRGNTALWQGDSSAQVTSALQGAAWYFNTGVFSRKAPERIVCIGNKRLLILNSRLPARSTANKIKIDYILLSHKAEVNISRLKDFFIYDLLIFDASVPPFRLQEWKNACKELTLRSFSVPDMGAFVVNL